ncbi:hypothetical protein AcW1_002576 [Taiwanofungus camphoratus]|nr:hypothetical protein AcV5_009742 [Antrodia cinnamomea]KAI0942792.1 hypothetical protein AcV7_002102 [Antrodia cinnamomea]KAI0943408.1 hypothetical protein AcW1_002576 [Antrodia cinnamomea]
MLLQTHCEIKNFFSRCPQTSSSDALTNDEIIELCKNAPQLQVPSDIPSLGPPPFYILTPDVIVKTGCDIKSWEARTMELVRSILVPRVLRFFATDDDSYLVMEYVKSHTLEKC